MEDKKFSMEYFQFFSQGDRPCLWPTWFTDALLNGEVKLRPEGGATILGSEKNDVKITSVDIEEGDYVMLTLGGNLCKLQFLEDSKLLEGEK